MKPISRAALGLLVISAANQGAAFADDKLTKELLRRVEALEKRASLADKLESENKQLRARLERTVATGERNKTKVSSNLATTPTTTFSQYNNNSEPQIERASNSNERILKEKAWQGVYVGFNAGYGQNLVGLTGYDTFFYSSGNKSDGEIRNYNSSALFSGPVIGGQIGYNHQFSNNIILGAELDLDYADVRNTPTGNIDRTLIRGNNFGFAGLFSSANSNSNTYDPGNSALYGDTSNTRIGMDWIGTARARLGYSLGNFMPYVTGGLAFGGLSGIINYAYSESYTGSSTTTIFEHGSNSIVQPGWVLGAGAEYMVADNWSIKGEYLYTQITGINIQTTGLSAYDNLADRAFGTNLSTNAFGIHQARVGLNYHTNWLGSSVPIAAKH
jgi:outer membrane immunogenic protein